MGLRLGGDSDWMQSGTPRWHPDGWELDRVVVPVSGSVFGRTAFMNTLTPWGAYDADTNMFLQTFSQDEHRQFPTLNLTFIGKRNGALPPDRLQAPSSIQQTSGYALPLFEFLGTGELPTTITYISSMTRLTTWSRTQPDVGNITFPAPPDLTPENVISLTLGSVDQAAWAMLTPNLYAELIAAMMNYFFSRLATYADVQEMVPGQYWRAIITQQQLLFPIRVSLT